MYAFVLLGVSGSAMSTLGVHVAARLSWPYLEEDDFHPPASLKKMYGGISLSDVDRTPAIDALARSINNQIQPYLVVACSALTRCLRQRLESAVQRPIRFVHLRVPAEVLTRRVGGSDHGEEARTERRPMLLGAAGESIEIDANGGIDVVAARVISRVRTLAWVHRP